MTSGPQVYIVDDDVSVREAVAWLMGTVGLPAIGFASGKAFLDQVPVDAQGCVILDIRMPEMGGLEVQTELRRRGYGVPVVMLTAHGDVPAAVRAMKEGAIDFIEKPFNNQLLIDTVLYAMSRQGKEPEAPPAEVVEETMPFALTPREREVLELLVSGHSNKEVSASLDISIKTAEYHRANIMKKAGATTLSDLVRKTARITVMRN